MNTQMLAVPHFAVERALDLMKMIEVQYQNGAAPMGAQFRREFVMAKECLEFAVKEGPPKMEPEVATALRAAFFKQDRT